MICDLCNHAPAEEGVNQLCVNCQEGVNRLHAIAARVRQDELAEDQTRMRAAAE